MKKSYVLYLIILLTSCTSKVEPVKDKMIDSVSLNITGKSANVFYKDTLIQCDNAFITNDSSLIIINNVEEIKEYPVTIQCVHNITSDSYYLSSSVIAFERKIHQNGVIESDISFNSRCYKSLSQFSLIQEHGFATSEYGGIGYIKKRYFTGFSEKTIKIVTVLQ